MNAESATTNLVDESASLESGSEFETQIIRHSKKRSPIDKDLLSSRLDVSPTSEGFVPRLKHLSAFDRAKTVAAMARLNLDFHYPHVFLQAMTHKSFNSTQLPYNERLAYLGT